MEKKLNLTYTARDGILYPNISLEREEAPSLGRFGRQWLENMQSNHPQRFISLRMQGTLNKTARRVDMEALERQETIYQQNLTANPPTQTDDTLEKACHLNSLRLIAEEIVMKEIVLTPR